MEFESWTVCVRGEREDLVKTYEISLSLFGLGKDLEERTLLALGNLSEALVLASLGLQSITFVLLALFHPRRRYRIKG